MQPAGPISKKTSIKKEKKKLLYVSFWDGKLLTIETLSNNAELSDQFLLIHKHKKI